mmetsp:Transcript_87884/g.121135  ORF Transcript_87884/g.121135 Transcript_87884/m.121135 type:complete len:227 (+) Transcript_87884:1183-1863(+)
MSVLFNLPSFLGDTYDYDDQQKANVSSSNDIGGLIGTVLAGIISDYTYSKRSPTSFVGVLCTTLIFYYYTFDYLNVSYSGVIVIYFVYGFCIQSAQNTIAASASADCGKSAGAKTRATVTVTGIIDGMGTIGSTVGQFTIARLVTPFGWQYGYLLLISVNMTLTMIPLGIILRKEINEIIEIRKRKNLGSLPDATKAMLKDQVRLKASAIRSDSRSSFASNASDTQ